MTASPVAVAGTADAPADVAADVVVVAAGASRRMGGIDKLLAPIGDRPLLAWTLAALATATVVRRIVVVTSAANVRSVVDAPWLPDLVIDVVVGGERRQESVAAGVARLGVEQATGGEPDQAAPGAHVILVHDGARPLVAGTLVDAVAHAAATHGAAIPAVPIAETVKRVEAGTVTGTIDRDTLAIAQTPQGVRADLLARAYARFPPDGLESFTDEAALLEACRIPVHVIPGDPSNLKVTVPGDLDRAAATLARAAGSGRPAPGVRVGIGHDQHPFGPGEPLHLGGIEIAGAPRLHGHSDGDVALHAIADALLGAAGSGDLGRLYPAGPSTPTGIASAALLRDVVARIARDGWRPLTLDLTIVGARPRLATHLDGMRGAIAALLGVAAGDVNVKASSGNLAGSDGAGRTVSAVALATIGPAA